MIIKIISRDKEQTESSIRAMVRYVRAEREQDADDGKCIRGYGGSNFGCGEDEGAAQLENFLELSRSNPGCRKPLMHVMISWDREEFPSPAQVRQAIAVWMHEAGADGLDAIWAVHGNTMHMHGHVLVCMVDPITGKVRDLGLWKRKSQYAKAKIIGMQNLTPCANDLYLPTANGDVAINPDASHWQGMDGFAPPRLEDPAEGVAKVRELVMPALERAASWAEFHEALATAGVGMRKSGRGIAFIAAGAEIKGSKISKKKCALGQLEKKFGAPYIEGPASAKAAPEDIKVIRNPDARFWRGREPEPDGPEVLPPLCPEAQAIEQRHGVKSRQRTAQAAVPAALERAEAAGGWRAFHEALAESGITVRPSGTGLVYVIGDVEVRASHVSRRRCLRPSLEGAFGAFEPAPEAVLRQASAVAASMGPEPVEDMPPELVPWWEDYARERAAWLEEERRLTKVHLEERRRLRERLREELDAQLAEAAAELRSARALGGRRCLPRGAGAALRMALRDRGAARGRAMRKVLAGEVGAKRRRFPDSFAGWLEAKGEAALASLWRRRGTMMPQEDEQAGPETAPGPQAEAPVQGQAQTGLVVAEAEAGSRPAPESMPMQDQEPGPEAPDPEEDAAYPRPGL